MGNPVPLYQELYLPVISPEKLEELKKQKEKKEETWGSITIDLNEGTEEKIPYSF